MSLSTSAKRMRGFFPRSVWRLAWFRLRQQSLSAVRSMLSRCSGFAIRSPKASQPEIPIDLDSQIKAAILHNRASARDRFLSGIDLAPIAEFAEMGVIFRGFVDEHVPGLAAHTYSLSVYPIQKEYTGLRPSTSYEL